MRERALAVLGFRAARAATVARAFRIYRAHLVTLIFTFVVGSFFVSQLPGIQNLLDQYFKNPGAAIVANWYPDNQAEFLL